MSESSDLTPVSVEQDGRILTGVGATVEDLEATMARFAPAEPASEPSAEPAAPPSPEPQKKTRGARRYDELVGEREAAKREADAAKREAAEVKARLAELEAKVTAPTSAPSPAAAPPPASPRASAPVFSFPSYEQYVAQKPDASWDDWQDAKLVALSDFKLSQLDLDTVVRRRIEADAASRTLQSRYADAVKRGQQTIADFDTVVRSAAHIDQENWPMDRLDIIGRLPNPERVIYECAKDPQLNEHLRTCDPVTFGMTIARFVPPGGVAPTASIPAGVSAPAPPPMQPVGSGSKTTVPPSADLAKRGFDFDASGYRERRAAERGMRRQ